MRINAAGLSVRTLAPVQVSASSKSPVVAPSSGWGAFCRALANSNPTFLAMSGLMIELLMPINWPC